VGEPEGSTESGLTGFELPTRTVLGLWQSVFEPWRVTPGWEFDLLRALPPARAAAVYRRAWAEARSRMMGKWRRRAEFGAVICILWLSVALVWATAAALGLGPLGRIAFDLVFHLTVGVAVFHPLARRQERRTLPYLRAAIADELLWLVRDERDSAPRRRLRATDDRLP